MMIEVTCDRCENVFEVPETRAGATTMCSSCGARVAVPAAEGEPAAVGAGAATAAAAVGGPAHPAAAPRGNIGVGQGAETTGGEWVPPGMEYVADERAFEPHIENELRNRNLFRLGLAMTVAFFAPIVGMPGKPLFFPEFSNFPGLSLAGIALLLPVIAGVTVMLVSRTAQPPLRSLVVTAAGSALFGLLLVDQTVRTMLSQAISTAPAAVTLSNILLLVGTGGLLISTRTRWYRPSSHLAYWIGAVAAVAYGLYLLIPTGGRMPIAEPFTILELSKMMGIAMLANIGLMVAAGVTCLMNTSGSLPLDASDKAGRAFRFLVGALVVPIALMALTVLTMPGAGQMLLPAITAAVKYALMFGGLMLLIPIGISDFLVGRAA